MQQSRNGNPPCLHDNGAPSCFYSQTDTATKLIIFVHGIFGSASDTWGDPDKGTFWPEMVKQDRTYVDYDLYLINYRTPYFNGALTLYETATNELEKLKSLRVFDRYKEIYFISHSMGGILVKSILTRLNRPQNLSQLRQVKGVVYLGTPSQGSSLATLLGWASQNPQLENLKESHLNAYLQDLEDRWIQLMDDRDKAQAGFPRAHCAYETRPTAGTLIVPREFASSRCDNVLHPLDFDHPGLAKPTGYNKDPYLWVMAKIRESGNGLLQDEETERTIQIECHAGLMPKLVPPEGRIYVLLLWPIPEESGGGGFVEYFAHPGSEWSWSSPKGTPAHAYRCQFTNYGNTTVFNVTMSFSLIFREAVRNPENTNATGSGPVALYRKWPVEVAKIDPGTNGFVFYIYNQSQKFAEVVLPQSAELWSAHENRRRNVRLIQAYRSGLQIMLVPFAEDK